MTETYLQKLTRERKARLNRIAIAAHKEIIPEPVPEPIIEISTNQEVFDRKEGTFKNIFQETCKYYRVSMLDVISPRRNDRVVLARHVIAHIASQHTKLSITHIASRIGRDKSTVIYALNRMAKLSTNEEIAADIAAIKQRVGL